MVTIAHISDPHVGSPMFVPNLMHRVIDELNEMAPDVVVVSGDLTADGFRPEYKAWLAYAERIEAPLLTVPGNHDSRNVGYLHFEELIGPRMWTHDIGDVRIVGVDSSEPDLNEGKVGRVHYDWIAERFSHPAALKVFVLHHHLLPDPGNRTGAEHGRRRRRPPRGAHARRRQRGPVGSQARSLRLAARRHVRRERRHGLVAARARTYEAVLQRARVRWRDPSGSTDSFPFGGRHEMARFSLFETSAAHREQPVQAAAPVDPA